MTSKKRLLVIDTLNVLFYLHHIKEPQKLWRFLADLRVIMDQFKVYKIVLACDGKGGSRYRKALHPGYKGDRGKRREQATPAEKARLERFLREDVAEIIEVGESLFGFHAIQLAGVEADDIIAWIVNTINLDDFEIMVMSSDSDLFQLLRPGVVQASYGKDMALPLSSKAKIPRNLWMNTDHFRQTFEIEPPLYAHVKALSGDTSDSIPSPEGVGSTLALRLIQRYGSLLGVQQNLDSLDVERLTEKARRSLKENFHQVWFNMKLVNLNYHGQGFADPRAVEVLGEENYSKLESINFYTPPVLNEPAIKELMYEHAKVNLLEKLDFWLHPFRGYSGVT